MSKPVTITADAIRAYLPSDCAGFFSVSVEDTLPSTNTALKAAAADGAPSGTVLIARRQSAGRGRLGRTFLSPQDTGLYMSVLFRPGLRAEDALFLTTCTAVACAEAIDAVRHAAGISSDPAKIKWVNDIYLYDRKVCGILAEAALAPDGGTLSYAVIGMGINLLPPQDGFPPELAATAGAVFPHSDAVTADGNFLAAEILRRLHAYLRAPADRTYLDAYRSRSLLDGREILVRPASSVGDTEIPAIALGIDDRAGLRVRYADDTEETLRSGEMVIDNSVQNTRASVHLREKS